MVFKEGQINQPEEEPKESPEGKLEKSREEYWEEVIKIFKNAGDSDNANRAREICKKEREEKEMAQKGGLDQKQVNESFKKILENETELMDGLDKIRKSEEGLNLEEEKKVLEDWYQVYINDHKDGLISSELMEEIDSVYKRQLRKLEEREKRKE